LFVRQADLVDDVRRLALKAEHQQMISHSQMLVAQWGTEVTLASTAVSPEILGEAERRGLLEHRVRAAGRDWGQPLAALLTLCGEVGRWWGPTRVADTSDLGPRIHLHYLGLFGLLANLNSRIRSEMAEGSLVHDFTPPLREGTPMLESPENLTARLGREFSQRLNDGRPTVRPRGKWLPHLPALGVLGLAVWSRLYPVLDSLTEAGRPPLWTALWRVVISGLSPSFLIGTAAAAIASYLVLALWVWAREKSRLEGQIVDEERHIAQQVRNYGQQVVTSLDQGVQLLQREFAALEALTQ
jgi:hypothetical protein